MYLLISHDTINDVVIPCIMSLYPSIILRNEYFLTKKLSFKNSNSQRTNTMILLSISVFYLQIHTLSYLNQCIGMLIVKNIQLDLSWYEYEGKASLCCFWWKCEITETNMLKDIRNNFVEIICIYIVFTGII